MSSWEERLASKRSTEALALPSLTSARAASLLPRSRPTITTLAPMLASPMAVALPIPEVAPVIRQTFPSMAPPCFSVSGLSISRSLRSLKIRGTPSAILENYSLIAVPKALTVRFVTCCVSHGDGDLSSSVPLSHMADRLRGFAQRIGAVDHRRHLAGLDQLLEEDQILESRRHDKRPQCVTHELSQHVRPDHATTAGEPMIVEPSAVRHECSLRGEGASELGQRMVRHIVEDEVVALIVLRE